MMFHFHQALSLGLIALLLGVTFLLFLKLNPNLKNRWTLFVGYLVVILAGLSILCSVLHAIWFYPGMSKLGYSMSHKYEYMQRGDGMHNRSGR